MKTELPSCSRTACKNSKWHHSHNYIPILTATLKVSYNQNNLKELENLKNSVNNIQFTSTNYDASQPQTGRSTERYWESYWEIPPPLGCTNRIGVAAPRRLLIAVERICLMLVDCHSYGPYPWLSTKVQFIAAPRGSDIVWDDIVDC